MNLINITYRSPWQDFVTTSTEVLVKNMDSVNIIDNSDNIAQIAQEIAAVSE